MDKGTKKDVLKQQNKKIEAWLPVAIGGGLNLHVRQRNHPVYLCCFLCIGDSLCIVDKKAGAFSLRLYEKRSK